MAQIKKTSWHFRLMRRMDVIRDYALPKDACEYRAAFLKAILLVPLAKEKVCPLVEYVD